MQYRVVSVILDNHLQHLALTSFQRNIGTLSKVFVKVIVAVFSTHRVYQLNIPLEVFRTCILERIAYLIAFVGFQHIRLIGLQLQVTVEITIALEGDAIHLVVGAHGDAIAQSCTVLDRIEVQLTRDIAFRGIVKRACLALSRSQYGCKAIVLYLLVFVFSQQLETALEGLVSALIFQCHRHFIQRRFFVIRGLFCHLHLCGQPVGTTVEGQCIPVNLEHDVIRRDKGLPCSRFTNAMEELQGIGAVAQRAADMNGLRTIVNTSASTQVQTFKLVVQRQQALYRLSCSILDNSSVVEIAIKMRIVSNILIDGTSDVKVLIFRSSLIAVFTIQLIVGVQHWLHVLGRCGRLYANDSSLTGKVAGIATAPTLIFLAGVAQRQAESIALLIIPSPVDIEEVFVGIAINDKGMTTSVGTS